MSNEASSGCLVMPVASRSSHDIEHTCRKITSNGGADSGGFGNATERIASLRKKSTSIASGSFGAGAGASAALPGAAATGAGVGAFVGGASTSASATIATTTSASRRTNREMPKYAAATAASTMITVPLTKRPASSARYAAL